MKDYLLRINENKDTLKLDTKAKAILKKLIPRVKSQDKFVNLNLNKANKSTSYSKIRIKNFDSTFYNFKTKVRFSFQSVIRSI